jgi:hypothetical protein
VTEAMKVYKGLTKINDTDKNGWDNDIEIKEGEPSFFDEGENAETLHNYPPYQDVSFDA